MALIHQGISPRVFLIKLLFSGIARPGVKDCAFLNFRGPGRWNFPGRSASSERCGNHRVKNVPTMRNDFPEIESRMKLPANSVFSKVRTLLEPGSLNPAQQEEGLNADTGSSGATSVELPKRYTIWCNNRTIVLILSRGK